MVSISGQLHRRPGTGSGETGQGHDHEKAGARLQGRVVRDEYDLLGRVTYRITLGMPLSNSTIDAISAAQQRFESWNPGTVTFDSTMISRNALLIILALLFSSCAHAESEAKVWLPYEPAKVTLEGRVTIVARFGPPNWGEQPETDMKLRVPILILSHPINVRGDLSSETNVEAFTDVREVQLQGHFDQDEFENKDVVVRGRLFGANTGWHSTSVLIFVDEIDKK